MNASRMAHVKHHFNTEASVFDDRVSKIVPYYLEMLSALVHSLPFPSTKTIRVLDLGCGTGTVSYLIHESFPHAIIHCVDIAPHMLTEAERKLRHVPHVTFEQADLQKYFPQQKYDAVVTSLALHHLETNADKAKMHRKVFQALKRGGVFASADITLSIRPHLQKYYLQKWADFIRKSFTPADIEKNHERYKREDRPSILWNELKTLERIGFRYTEILWKYYNFVTYAAYK
jgi:tRNA (cmo5U34)-methyltransferase